MKFRGITLIDKATLSEFLNSDELLIFDGISSYQFQLNSLASRIDLWRNERKVQLLVGLDDNNALASVEFFFEFDSVVISDGIYGGTGKSSRLTFCRIVDADRNGLTVTMHKNLENGLIKLSMTNFITSGVKGAELE